MQQQFLQEKEEINRLHREDLHRLMSGMLYTKDVGYYMDYLKEQDEIMCMKIHGRKPSQTYEVTSSRCQLQGEDSQIHHLIRQEVLNPKEFAG